jgi:uncharacterized protein
MNFQWNPRKAETNRRKHGVSFSEAATVFGDDLSITVFDPDHSDSEERFITVGWSNRHRLLIVSHTERNDIIRIISACTLTQTEQKAYEEETN